MDLEARRYFAVKSSTVLDGWWIMFGTDHNHEQLGMITTSNEEFVNEVINALNRKSMADHWMALWKDVEKAYDRPHPFMNQSPFSDMKDSNKNPPGEPQ